MAVLGHSHKAVLASVLLFVIRSVYMQGAPPCDLPFFESSEVCVTMCPEFQFGNHSSGACEPLPNDYRVAINATQFIATAIVNASLGMPVISFTTIINNTFFQDPDVVTISVVRSDQTAEIFSLLENGANSESITNPASGLPAVITLERAVIFSNAPPPTIELPATFDFDINIAVVKGGLIEAAQALGVVVVREVCDPNPCENNGTCIPQGLDFSCECIPGYGGTECETDLPFCQNVVCMNGGFCVEGLGTQTECVCFSGFSGPLCEIDISVCDSAPCLNEGNCTDEAGLSFSCTCVMGYSGDTCETDLDFCQNDTCDNGGSCREGPGSETSCDCMEGFTGVACETDLDFCQNDTCLNGGMCIEQYGPNTTCLCLEGVIGDACETDLDFCENETCMNGGSCIEELGANTSCICLDGYSGASCETDLDFCQNDTCLNGGSCIEGNGTETTCSCTEGFTGLECEVDLDNFCQNDTCMNGGNCTEGFGPEVSCMCPEGFNGNFCENDLDFCEIDTCTRNGNCSEGLGTETFCDCFPGYSGLSCETDLDIFCMPNPCRNGGSCNEGPGDTITCDCLPGYSGLDCGTDLDFCTPESCLNNGTCIENVGEITTCSCAPGFTGTICDSDDPDYVACTSEICLNGGSCIEEFGPATSCVCSLGYSGSACTEDDESILFCEFNNTCQNGAACLEEFGPSTSCSCAPGYSGPACEDDLDFCTSATCQNGGTCQEGLGNITTCNCSTGYTGATCEEDDQSYVACASDSCMNEATCMEAFGPNIQCLCPPGFNGTLCEIDLTPSSRGIIGIPTYVFWILVGVAGGVIVIALYLVVCLICVVHYKHKHKTRTYAFEGGNTQETSELSLMGFEHVVREGVQTTSNNEMNASTGSLASNLSDSGDDSVDAMDTVRPYAMVHNPANVNHPNRAAQNPTNEMNTVQPYATLRNPDGDPVSTSGTNTINPYATLQNPTNVNKQATTAALPNPKHIPSSDRPSASTQNPDPPYATVKNTNKTDANQPYARVRVTFTKPAERTGAPGETNPLQSITEPAGPLIPERTSHMFETASPPMTPEPPASPATPITARTGSNTSSPTSLPSPQHTSTPIQTLARPDHSTVITNPIAVQFTGDAPSASDTGSGRPTWSLDPTSASTTLVAGAEDFSGYVNKKALLAMAASTDLPLSGSDDSTVLANEAAVGVTDGPPPPVVAFGREGSPVSQQPTMTSDLERRSPGSQEVQSQTALQQAIQYQLEEHSQQQLQGLQESFERYTLRLEQQLTKQQKNWEEDMRRRKAEEDWARHEKKRVEMMMDSQRQSLVSFDRSTSPTSPISSESEDEVFLSGKVATSPAGTKNTKIQRQELLTPSNAVKVTIPSKSPPRDSSTLREGTAQFSPVLLETPPAPPLLPSPPPREHSVPAPPPLKESQPAPPLLSSPPLREEAVMVPPPLKATPLTQPLPPSPPLTTPLPSKETLPAPPPSKDTPPHLKDTTSAKRIPPPKPSRDSLIPAAPPLQDSVPPRPPPPPPPPPPPTDTPMPAPPRSSAWPPAPVLPPPPRVSSLSPSASPQRPTIPAPLRQKPMILPPAGIRYVKLERPDLKTSFGFVVLSNTKRKGCVISRLVPDSPAYSCGQLFIMDEVLAVNGQDVCSMDHAAILALIKSSGTTVQLTVQQPTIIIKKRPRGRRNLSSEFSGPLRRFESIQEVDEEDEDDEMGESDDEPSRFQRTWSLPIGNKEAEIRFPSSQYVHNSVSSHVDTSQGPLQQALLPASPQQDQQAASKSSAQEFTPGTGQSRPVVEQYDDVHFIRHKAPKLLEVPASTQFDESKVKFGRSHVSPNQHKKNTKHDPLTAGADSELKAALRVRRKQLKRNGMTDD